MWPGAKGSLAIFVSTRMKIAKRGTETPRLMSAVRELQPTLPPRSRATRSVVTAAINTAAPVKSMRAKFFLQSESSVRGMCKTKNTATNASMHNGTCPRNAHRQPTESARIPPIGPPDVDPRAAITLR